MKPFAHYLQETNRVFEFCIKIAGCEIDQAAQAKIKSALEAYSVESVGKVKRLPIQEHVDFPGQGPCECHLVEVTVRYPVVSDQIAQVVAEKLGISRKQVIARTRGEEEIRTSVVLPKKAKDGSVLNNPDLEAADGGQELVGQSRKDSMLKELETRKYDFAAKTESSGPVDAPKINPISPVGSKQNTIPSPVKGK
jgi:hypothetical protein